MAKETITPAYQAYTVIKREGADDFFLAIGAAFEHRDQRGFNVILQALPIDGRIVLRLPKKDEESDSDRREDGRDSRPRTNGNRPRSDRR